MSMKFVNSGLEALRMDAVKEKCQKRGHRWEDLMEAMNAAVGPLPDTTGAF